MKKLVALLSVVALQCCAMGAYAASQQTPLQISGVATIGDLVKYNGSNTLSDTGIAYNALAPKASPTFTGTVTLPAGQVVNGVTLTNSGSSTAYLNAAGSYSSFSLAGNGYGIYGSPLVQSNAMHSFGDSITAGYLVTGTTDYPYYASQAIGATLTNNALGGDQACDMADKVMFDEYPGPSLKYSGVNPIYTLMIGTNDANVKGTGAYEVNYNNCVLSSMLWMGIPSDYKVNANSAGFTKTGTWTAGTGSGGNGQPIQSIFSSTNGSTATGTITTYGGPLYILYRTGDAWTGTFTYQVDAGSAVSVNSFPVTAVATQNGGTDSIVPITVTGLSAGVHTVLITVTSATSANAYVEPIALETVPPNPQWGGPLVFNLGVVKQCGDSKSSTTLQYNNDAQTDVNILQAAGLLVRFAPVRNNLGSSSAVFADTCSGPGLHPNATGHQYITEGLLAAMQATPYPGGTSLFTLSGNNAAYTGGTGGIVQSPAAAAGIANYLQTNGSNVNSTTNLNPGVILYSASGIDFGMDVGYSNSRYDTRVFAPTSGSDITFAFAATTPTSQSNFTTAVTIRGDTGAMGIGTTAPATNALLDVRGPIKTMGYTVSTLPTGSAGMRAHVTDATSCTFMGALTGGGSTFCPVVHNGTSWVGG